MPNRRSRVSATIRSQTRLLILFGYIWHLRARPDSNGTWTWCLDTSKLLLGQETAALFKTARELLKVLSCFRAGPRRYPVSTCMPIAHMSTIATSTPSNAAMAVTQSSCQDTASAGCSWMKNRPACTCMTYNFMQHQKWTPPASGSAATTSGSCL